LAKKRKGRKQVDKTDPTPGFSIPSLGRRHISKEEMGAVPTARYFQLSGGGGHEKTIRIGKVRISLMNLIRSLDREKRLGTGWSQYARTNDAGSQ